MPHGVYVHLPWCRRHCPYCSFFVLVDRDPPWRAWLDGVLRDHARCQALLEAAGAAGPAHTLYLGGGTPALAPVEVLAALVAALPLAPDAERTLEVDPGTVDRDRLAALLDLGFDRLSLGVQTFDRAHGKRLGRAHSLAASERLLADVQALAPRTWSIDLIFALPGQTLAELDADLDRVLDLGPPHVSLYGLTIEPGTGFARLRDRGRLVEAPPALWRAMYDRIHERLTAGGWQRYEISNYARPGHRSRHNEAIWQGGHYLGLGPAAHGFLPPTREAPRGRRTRAWRDLERWRAEPWEEVELLDPEQAAIDLLLGALRHDEGVSLPALEGLGYAVRPAVVAALGEAALLQQQGDRLRLTPSGAPLADGITARLVDALLPLGAARSAVGLQSGPPPLQSPPTSDRPIHGGNAPGVLPLHSRQPTVPSDPDHTDPSGGFGLELDEDLLNAALSAVEKRAPRRPTEAHEDEDAAQDLLDFEIELEAEAQAPGPDGVDEAALAALAEARDEALQQVEQLQARVAELEQELERGQVERRRLQGALRRTEDSLARESGKVERERQMRRDAEEQVTGVRRKAEQLQDDFDQLRDRRRRERDEDRHHGHVRSVEAILPVLDHLELALSFRNEDPAQVVHGIGMIVQQFHQALGALGVQRVVAGPGILFDPEVHEAITEVVTEELLPGSIVEELRPGYVIGTRLLRAARVSVAASATEPSVEPSVEPRADPTDASDAPAPVPEPAPAVAGGAPPPEAADDDPSST